MASFVGVQTVAVVVWPAPEQVVQDEHVGSASEPEVEKKPELQMHAVRPALASAFESEQVEHCPAPASE